MEQEGKLAPNHIVEVRVIFSEFLAEVVKLEELVTASRKFLIHFQQSIEFLRKPSIHESSKLVQDIIKANETNRVKLYVEAGCVNAYDSAQNVDQMNTSFSGLQDHLTKAKAILEKLENLAEKASTTLTALVSESSSEHVEVDCGEDVDKEDAVFEPRPFSLTAADWASYMAVIYSMVKQDYLMQERIISSLSLKSSAGELDSYSFMWSLRPFIDDDIVHQALRHVS